MAHKEEVMEGLEGAALNPDTPQIKTGVLLT